MVLYLVSLELSSQIPHLLAQPPSIRDVSIPLSFSKAKVVMAPVFMAVAVVVVVGVVAAKDAHEM